MKKLLLAFIFLPLTLSADEAIKNGDFSDGTSHWSGDGRSAATFDSDPTEKGMVIRLIPHDWTKATQDCRPIGSVLAVTISYTMSSDFKFSQKMEDYLNVPDHLGYGAWSPFQARPGDWVFMLSDFGSNTGATYWIVDPEKNADTNGIRTFTCKTRAFNKKGDKTLTLAFPPGSGRVTILNVSMTDSPLPQE